MVEFGGWEMPVQYSGIIEEHHAVRREAGLFDISHMGRVLLNGLDADRLLERLVTSQVNTLKIGQIRYGLMCNADGGILDDVLVYRIDEEAHGLVVNASNRLKIVPWLEAHRHDFETTTDQLDLDIDDKTMESSMFAIQGPRSIEILQPLTTTNLSTMKYYSGMTVELAGFEVYLSRTGYTGEDGFEIIVTNPALELWNQIVEAGTPLGLKPCGLGCRDTLRLEAAMPLYGHELSEALDPLTAGLAFAVKLEKDFVGKDALVSRKQQPSGVVRVGLRLTTRRIAREHSDVYWGGRKIGVVSSGTFSPTLEQSIAMAYLESVCAKEGTLVEVDIRGKRESATIVPLPFYKRN